MKLKFFIFTLLFLQIGLVNLSAAKIISKSPLSAEIVLSEEGIGDENPSIAGIYFYDLHLNVQINCHDKIILPVEYERIQTSKKIIYLIKLLVDTAETREYCPETKRIVIPWINQGYRDYNQEVYFQTI